MFPGFLIKDVDDARLGDEENGGDVSCTPSCLVELEDCLDAKFVEDIFPIGFPFGPLSFEYISRMADVV